MEYRTIPNTDLSVSSICLGTMTWGQQNTEVEAHEQLDYAFSHGINFMDTAEIYPVPPERELQGLTEEYIGSWLIKRGKRDDIILASKVAPSTLIRTRSAPPEGRTPLNRNSIREAIEGSLSRLRTDYLDLYQVHWPERKTNYFGVRGYTHEAEDPATPLEETLSALSELITEGKVRAIGLSNETPWGMMEYLRLSREKGLARVVSIQNQYSLINRTYEMAHAEVAMREGISLLAYSPLSMGVLSGKYLNGAEPPGARFTLFERNRSRYNPPEAQAAITRYVEIAKKHELDPAAMAIAFVAMQPFVTSTIIGATNLEQLRVDIDAGDMILSPEVLADIARAYKEIPDPTV